MEAMRWIAAWAPLVVIMIINGIAREKLYGPRLSELRAHQVSTLTGAVFYGLYVWFALGWLGIDSAREAWRLGGVWLALTIAFEFGFGHYIAGHSWARLVADYDLRKGRVWSLFLVWVLIGPRVVLALQSLI